MKFYLKVHSIIGGAPGEPGSPGGAVPGGDIGFGFGPGGGNGSNNSEHVGFMNDLTSLMPAVNLMSAVLFGFTGKGFGNIAQGDPNFSPGNTGPGTTGAQGGGPTVSGPVSQTSRAITQAIAPPAPVTPPPAAPLADDRKRNRIGRQETILTSRSALSDAPTYRPTLLGQ